MAMGLSRNTKTILSEINITPMCDVMLVLLIIFMLTAPLMQQGLPVNLPEAAAPALKRTNKDIIITVQNDGKIYLGDDKETIPIGEVEGRLSAIFMNRQQKDLFIKADTDLKYGTVVKIMSDAKKAGVDRIGMITQPETTVE
jgi:biopolymer transport protein TolR